MSHEEQIETIKPKIFIDVHYEDSTEYCKSLVDRNYFIEEKDDII